MRLQNYFIITVSGPTPGPNEPDLDELTGSSSPGGQYMASGFSFVVELNSDSSNPSGHRGFKITYWVIIPPGQNWIHWCIVKNMHFENIRNTTVKPLVKVAQNHKV